MNYGRKRKNLNLKKVIDMKKLSTRELLFTTVLVVSLLSVLGLLGSIVLWIWWGWSVAWRTGLTSILSFIFVFCISVAVVAVIERSTKNKK